MPKISCWSSLKKGSSINLSLLYRSSEKKNKPMSEPT